MKRYSNKMINNHGFSNFFDDAEGYSFFIEKMQEAAAENNLPLCLEHSSPLELTMNDIKAFSQTFKKDTGLDINFQMYTCDNCDKLHFSMIIDYKPIYKRI